MKKHGVCFTKKKNSNNTGRQYRRRTIASYSIQDNLTTKTPFITKKTARKPLQVVSASKASCNLMFSSNETPHPSTWKEQDTKIIESLVKFKSKLSFVSSKDSDNLSNTSRNEPFNEQGDSVSHSVDSQDSSEHSLSMHSLVSMRRSRKLHFVKESSKSCTNETKAKLSAVNSDESSISSVRLTETKNDTNEPNESTNHAVVEGGDKTSNNAVSSCQSQEIISKLTEKCSRNEETNKRNDSYSSHECSSPVNTSLQVFTFSKDIPYTTEIASKQTLKVIRDKTSDNLNSLLLCKHHGTCDGKVLCGNVTSLSSSHPVVKSIKTSQNDTPVSKACLKTFRKSSSETLRKSLQEARILALKDDVKTENQQETSPRSSEKLVCPSLFRHADWLRCHTHAD